MDSKTSACPDRTATSILSTPVPIPLKPLLPYLDIAAKARNAFEDAKVAFTQDGKNRYKTTALQHLVRLHTVCGGTGSVLLIEYRRIPPG